MCIQGWEEGEGESHDSPSSGSLLNLVAWQWQPYQKGVCQVRSCCRNHCHKYFASASYRLILLKSTCAFIKEMVKISIEYWYVLVKLFFLFVCHLQWYIFCTVADEGTVPAMGNWPKWFGKMFPLRRLKATLDEEVINILFKFLWINTDFCFIYLQLRLKWLWMVNWSIPNWAPMPFQILKRLSVLCSQLLRDLNLNK